MIVKSKYIDTHKTCVENTQKILNERYDEDHYDFTHTDPRAFGCDIERLMIGNLLKLGIKGYHNGLVSSKDPDFISIRDPFFTTEYKSHLIKDGSTYKDYVYSICRYSKIESEYYNDKSFTLVLINYKFKRKYDSISDEYCKEMSYRENIHECIITDFYIIYNCTYKNLPDQIRMRSNGELNIENYIYEHVIL